MRYRGLIPYFIIITCLLTGRNGISQIPEKKAFKVFLVGDAGENDSTGATLHDLKIKLEENPNSVVLFLGDNCYLKPFFSPVETGGYDGSKQAKNRLMSQLNILREYKGSVYFVPGNHDWWNQSKLKKGQKLLLAEQKFIEDTLRNFTTILNHESGTFLPTNGSAGPVSRDFDDGKMRIIFIDTYRLMLAEERKNDADTLLLDAFYKEFNAQLADATNKHEKIIVAAHHPAHSKGKHSNPLLFVERMSKRAGYSNSNYPPYTRMVNHLNSLLAKYIHPDIFYVSGHEHSLEYFLYDSLHYIVSGAGSKTDDVELESCQDATECWQWREEGFFEIDFYESYERILMYHRPYIKSEIKVLCISGCK